MHTVQKGNLLWYIAIMVSHIGLLLHKSPLQHSAKSGCVLAHSTVLKPHNPVFWLPIIEQM